MNEVEVPPMPSRVKCGACRIKKRKQEAKTGWSHIKVRKRTPFGLMQHYITRHPDAFVDDDIVLMFVSDVQFVNRKYNEILDSEQSNE